MNRRRFLSATGAASLLALAGCAGDDDADDDLTDTDDGSGGNGNGKTGNGDDANGNEENGDEENGDGGEATTDTENGEETQGVDVQAVEQLETAPAEQPPYAAWFGNRQVIETDFERARQSDLYARRLDELEDSEERQDGSEPLYPFADSVGESFPANSSVGLLLLVGFSALAYPVLEDITFPSGEPVEQPVMSATRLTNAGSVVVLTGEIDTARLREREDVTELDSVGRFTLYENSAGEETAPFATDDQRLVLPAGQGQEELQSALETALETAESGISVDDPDFSWLLDTCGAGAFTLGAHRDDTGENNQTITDSDFEYGIPTETLEAFEGFLSDAVAQLLVVDVHDGGRVTRSGLVFESESAVPSKQELATVMAGTADRVNVLVEGNRVVVEGFFGQ